MSGHARQKTDASSNDSQVLQILRQSREPLSAYEIMARFKNGRAAPPTVYRALGHLIEAGLVHRLESRNAFVACKHKASCVGAAIFMLCAQCGRAFEHRDPELEAYLRVAALRQDFHPSAFTLEVKGLCGSCEGAAVTAG